MISNVSLSNHLFLEEKLKQRCLDSLFSVTVHCFTGIFFFRFLETRLVSNQQFKQYTYTGTINMIACSSLFQK